MYVRPIEGITAVVDLEEMKIIEYHDRFRVPVPKAEGTEYRESKQKPPFGPLLRGLATMQSDGPGFEIDGHTIRLVKLISIVLNLFIYLMEKVIYVGPYLLKTLPNSYSSVFVYIVHILVHARA